MRMAGCGLGALEEPSACIGMLPSLSRPNRTRLNKNISAICHSVAKECCLEAAQDLHIAMGKPLDEVVDVIVTVVGTWHFSLRCSCCDCLDNWESTGCRNTFQTLSSM